MSSDSDAGGDDDPLDRWVDPETIFGRPEDRFGDPESELPPDVAPATDEEPVDFSAVDPALLNRFVVILLLVKLGVLLGSVGVLLIGFRGQLELGGGLLAAALLAFVRAAHHYRSWEGGDDADGDGADDDSDANDADAEAAAAVSDRAGRNR